MGADDDADCVEHVWQLVEIVLDQGAAAEYECVRCEATTIRLPGQPFPQTI